MTGVIDMAGFVISALMLNINVESVDLKKKYFVGTEL
jgi:hypothetical protein